MSQREDISETVKVYIRRRPTPAAQTALPDGVAGVTSIASDARSCDYYMPSTRSKHSFNAHQFFPLDVTQEQVFETTTQGIVDSVLQGYSGSVLAYGPTGSGKTHTMRGEDLPTSKGVIPRCIEMLLRQKGEGVEIWASYVQIYCEVVTDLLPCDSTGAQYLANPLVQPSQGLQLREREGGGVYFEGVTKYPIRSDEDIYILLSRGDANRATAATNANEASSRSHAVLLLSVLIPDTSSASSTTTPSAFREGRLTLVDLAGSERSSASAGRALQRAEEAKSINLSLSALGNVMQALAEKRSHVPYRDSKLTRLLQHSLGQNARTAVIVTIHQEGQSGDERGEVLSALRFAQRAMLVQVLARPAEVVLDYEALYRATVHQLQRIEQPYQHSKEDMEKKLREKEERIQELQLEVAALKEQVQSLQEDRKAAAALAAAVPVARPAPSSFSSAMSSSESAAAPPPPSWPKEWQEIQARHQQELQRLQQARRNDQQQARLAAQQQQIEHDRLLATISTEREQLLKAMQDLRTLTEKSAQQETYYKERLADLLAEGIERQQLLDDQQAQIAAMQKKSEAQAAELIRLQMESAHMVSKDRLQEMEQLFVDTVERLTNRVKNLEQNAPSSSSVSTAAKPGNSNAYAQAMSTFSNAQPRPSGKVTLPPTANGERDSTSAGSQSSGERIVRLEPGGRIRAGGGATSKMPMTHSSSSGAIK